jgi:hypothetical protein
MATFENRSRYAVEVKHRDDLLKTFPYDQPERARAYLLELRKHGYKPKLLQLEDTIRYRVRAAGHKTQIFTAGSWAAARRDAARIEGEHATGLFVDYTKAHNVTVAQLMQTYIDKECTGHKGKDGEVYRLRAFIADSKGELKKQLAKDDRPSASWRRAAFPAAVNAAFACFPSQFYVVGGVASQERRLGLTY